MFGHPPTKNAIARAFTAVTAVRDPRSVALVSHSITSRQAQLATPHNMSCLISTRRLRYLHTSSNVSTLQQPCINTAAYSLRPQQAKRADLGGAWPYHELLVVYSHAMGRAHADCP